MSVELLCQQLKDTQAAFVRLRASLSVLAAQWRKDAAQYKDQANLLRNADNNSGFKISCDISGMDYQAGCLLARAKEIENLLK